MLMIKCINDYLKTVTLNKVQLFVKLS